MAKAQIVTENGTKVTIEGDVDEVANLVRQFDRSASPTLPAAKVVRDGAKAGPQDRVLSLATSGFFKRPQGLAAIRAALEEQGHFYPVTTLSPVLLRLVRSRNLRRIKAGNVWSYVQP